MSKPLLNTAIQKNGSLNKATRIKAYKSIQESIKDELSIGMCDAFYRFVVTNFYLSGYNIKKPFNPTKDLTIYLPELLRYRPKYLKDNDCFWFTSNHFGKISRLNLLDKILNKLR